MGDFYNTNQEEGEELQTSKEAARRQTQIILSHFTNNPEMDFTAEDLNKLPELQNVLRTSIRRALTDLEEEGLITYEGQRRSSDTEKKISIYKFNKNPQPIKRKATRKELLELLLRSKEVMSDAVNTQPLDLIAQADFNTLIDEISQVE